jgi:hypothetical protein
MDRVIGFLHGGSLLFQRIHSPILSESGLRTAAQPPTECWTPSPLLKSIDSRCLEVFGDEPFG